MDADFWLEAWENGNTGFHRNEYHPALMEIFPTLDLPKGSHILVPFCGKSLDMIWLADKGFKVIGIEISPLATKEFFENNNIPYQIEKCNEVQVYKSENITIYNGDLFLIKTCDLPSIEGIYDRAALVALPPEMRGDYLQKIWDFTKKGAKKLLITFEYPQEKVKGPPFSVSEDEVKTFFCKNKECQIDLIREQKVEIKSPKFLEAGLKQCSQKIFRIIS